MKWNAWVGGSLYRLNASTVLTSQGSFRFVYEKGKNTVPGASALAATLVDPVIGVHGLEIDAMRMQDQEA